MTEISADEIRRLLDYDPSTGIFKWRVRASSRRQRGSIAGRIDLKGYLRIGINRKGYLGHRLAFVAMTGEWPQMLVDHINRDKADNRWENLREVGFAVNAQNRSAVVGATGNGFVGITANRGKWQAQIRHMGKPKYLGLYSTQEAAHAAYMEAKRLYHPGSV